MKIGRHSVSGIHVLADYLEAGGLVKEGGTNALPDDVPVSAAAHHLHLLALHDLLQLRAHLANFPHRLDVDKMIRAPLTTVSVGFPLLVHVQVRQMIRLRNLKYKIVKRPNTTFK